MPEKSLFIQQQKDIKNMSLPLYRPGASGGQGKNQKRQLVNI